MIQNTGIFSLMSLPTMCEGKVVVETILSCHQDSPVVAGWNMVGCGDIYTILHHAGPVVYDAREFAGIIRILMPIIALFYFVRD